MKRFLTIAGALILTATAGFAFDIPRGVFSVEELEEARAQAADKNRPVVFLVSRKSLKPT